MGNTPIVLFTVLYSTLNFLSALKLRQLNVFCDITDLHCKSGVVKTYTCLLQTNVFSTLISHNHRSNIPGEVHWSVSARGV